MISPKPPQPGWVSANFSDSVCFLFFWKEQNCKAAFIALCKFSDMQTKVLFSKLNACFMTSGIQRWNESEGTNLSTNNPTVTKRNTCISKGPFLLLGQVWSFSVLFSTVPSRAVSACLVLNKGVYPTTQWFLFSHETSECEKEFAPFYSYNETFFYLITYLR